MITPDMVKACYRVLLGREAETEDVVKQKMMLPDLEALLRDFMVSPEYQHKLRRFIGSNIITNFDDAIGHIDDDIPAVQSPGKNSALKVDMGGLFVVVDPSEPEFGRHIARDATWEPHIVRTIRDNLSTGQVFVDVGANVGIMSFHAAQIVGPLGKVISFEPNEANARLFLLGLLANGFAQFVRLHRSALSDRCELFALEGGSNTSLVRPEAPARLVQSLRGDELLHNEPAIHFIKLDIEGHEPFAIRGLQETIRRHKPLMLCEFNPRCLKSHFGVAQEEFAHEIYELTDTVRVIEYDGNTHDISGAESLLDMWARRNRHAVQTGHLPDGVLHFDLLFRTS